MPSMIFWSNVAVHDHSMPKTATLSRSWRDMLLKMATSNSGIAEIGIDYMSAKPKTAKHQETLLFLTTFAGLWLESLPKSASSVIKKRCVAVIDLESLPFSATNDRPTLCRIAGDAGRWLAARYDCVLRAYSAPSTVAPCPAGPAGRFAPPPEIWAS